jgi:fructoselysine-6-P-deglycase FrlB-like protein
MELNDYRLNAGRIDTTESRKATAEAARALSISSTSWSGRGTSDFVFETVAYGFRPTLLLRQTRAVASYEPVMSPSRE